MVTAAYCLLRALAYPFIFMFLLTGVAEPMNTFLASGSNDAPIRVSYHNQNHYNAIMDPNFSTFGVGLGFSDLRPGVGVEDIRHCLHPLPWALLAWSWPFPANCPNFATDATSHSHGGTTVAVLLFSCRRRTSRRCSR